MKNSNDTIWNRTSDLPICSAAIYIHTVKKTSSASRSLEGWSGSEC